MDFIQVDKKGLIATITLANEAKKNALSSALLDQLITALDRFRSEGIRVVLLRARKGVKVWSSGHDISELPRGGKDPLGYDDALERALRAVKEFPMPVIAMVQGSVWGGACDLALSCDLVIGDPSCSFAITPVNIGLPYNLSGLLQFAKRLPLHIVKEMFFTASPIDAEKAERIGILNHLVQESEFEIFPYKMAELICTKAPLSVSAIKEVLRLLSGAAILSPQDFERITALRKEVYNSQDYLEGIRAFEEKRKPRFQGE